MTATKITTRWTTIATVGDCGSVSRDENRSAHGGVCLLQARKGANGTLGRKVNSNGRHQETGEAFPLDSETLARWERIARGSR
jgi:hypothetical protein